MPITTTAAHAISTHFSGDIAGVFVSTSAYLVGVSVFWAILSTVIENKVLTTQKIKIPPATTRSWVFCLPFCKVCLELSFRRKRSIICITGGERVRQSRFDFRLRAEAPLASLKAANKVIANNNYAYAA